MIARIRIVRLKPGTLDDYRAVARDWRDLLHKHGGRVLGFYANEAKNTVTGIAEYESREHLGEILRECEAEEAFARIRERSVEFTASFEEEVLDKLEIDS